MLVWGDGGGIKLEISNWNFLFPVLHLQFRNYSVTEEKPRLTPEKFLHKGFKYIYILDEYKPVYKRCMELH